MRRLIIILCCLAATSLRPAPLRAQPDPVDPPEAGPAIAAFNQVESMVREWRTADDGPAFPSCRAASITLRLGGEVVGRAAEVAQTEEARAGVVLAALRAALADAEPRLRIPRDALYESTRRDLARQLTVSLQLAGEFIPIQPKDAAEAMAMVEAGVEGVAARLGDRTAAVFPERMLTTQSEPGATLASLVGRLAQDPILAVEPLSKLARDRGAVFYRFRVTHLAQASPRDTPVFLTRCTKYIPLTQLDEQSLRLWAERLAANLLSRPWTSDGKYGLAGTIDPISGRSLSPHAGPYEQALAAYAIMSFRGIANAQWRDINTPQVDAWLENIARHLAALEPEETDPSADPAAAAMVLLVLERLLVQPPSGSVSGGEKSMVNPVMVDLKKRCMTTVQDSVDGRSPVSDGQLALALFAAQSSSGTKVDPAAIRALYLRLGPGKLPAAMPWLGWADLNTESATHEPAIGALRDLRAVIWGHQLRPETLPPSQHDLAGGILFTSSPQPMPTWHTARPLAFIATMLGSEKLTENREVAGELSRLLLSLRFLRQLTAGEAECFMYENPDRAQGGVRASLWDQRMPIEATAMTLITVSETIRSLDAIRTRQPVQQDK